MVENRNEEYYRFKEGLTATTQALNKQLDGLVQGIAGMVEVKCQFGEPAKIILSINGYQRSIPVNTDLLKFRSDALKSLGVSKKSILSLLTAIDNSVK